MKFVYLIGVISFVAGVLMSLQMPRMSTQQQFQTKAIVSLACFEFPSLLAFVFANASHRSLAAMFPAVVMTLVGNIAFVLPKALNR